MSNLIKKENLLKFLPETFVVENEVNPERVCVLNDSGIEGNGVYYLVTREFRVEDNFALQYAKNLNNEVSIIFYVPDFGTECKKTFFHSQFKITKSNCEKLNLKYIEIYSESELHQYLSKGDIGVLIKDFNPLDKMYFSDCKFKIVEVDSHNICPARSITKVREYNAATLRRKIYYNISEYLTQYPPTKVNKGDAYKTLDEFINMKLYNYAKYKNNPLCEVTSNLSRFLHYGFISSQRVAIEIIKSDNSTENKEAFLEELVVRKELSDNFCLFCSDYKSLEGISNWAKETLNVHRNDIRTNIFTTNELENAQTYDELWNASQKQLLKDGGIHGYLRMYWAKKILEWSATPEAALQNAIYLNDKYSFDAPDPNGYVGILWSIGALHDRAFAQRPVSGKIRMMTYNGAKSKFDVKAFIEKYNV